jgi:nucleoside-diphosphate-sugar epimerase
VYAVGLDRAAGVPMRRVYVEGLGHVAARLKAAEFASTRVVYVSSTSVYGQTDGSVVGETSPTEPLEDSGKIVLEAEQTLRAVRPDAILARSAGQYGPGRLLRAESLRRGEPIVGLPEKWLNLIHVDDAVNAVNCLIENSPPGSTFTLADGTPVRRREFYAYLARLIGAPEPTWQAPPQPLPVSERVDRRVAAPGLRALGWLPDYLDYRSGLEQATGITRIA